jgi:hypothetical protein
MNETFTHTTKNALCGAPFEYRIASVKWATRQKLPGDLSSEYETHLEGIFNMIRLVRNESGHPTGVVPESNVVMAYLQAFPSFALKVKAFETYFKKATL